MISSETLEQSFVPSPNYHLIQFNFTDDKEQGLQKTELPLLNLFILWSHDGNLLTNMESLATFSSIDFSHVESQKKSPNIPQSLWTVFKNEYRTMS